MTAPVPAAEEHCADHASMAADASMSMQMSADMHAHTAPDVDAHPQHDESNPDCCRSMSCNCPCIQMLALSLSLPYVPTALPAALPAQVVTTPLLDTGISGQFRPPI